MLTKLTLSVLIVCFSIGWAAQVGAQGPLLVPAPGSPVKVGPGSGEIVLADLDRDGHLDMLTKHLLGQNVAARLGDGKGQFVPLAAGPMRFGYQPGAIWLGDVNKDSLLDLGVASKEGQAEYVHILLGNGRGGFDEVPASPFSVSAAIETYKPMLRFGDVNEDGKLDIVTANGRRNSIEILFGDGRGGFSTGSFLKLEPGQDLYTFTLGDVDGDGHLDVVIAGSVETPGVPGRLVIQRGDGKGTFTDAPGSPLSVPPSPHLRALADLNSDRHLDIVLGHGRSQHLSVLLNRGKGMFTPAPASPYDIGAEAFAVVVADVDRDWRNDLVAATAHSVTVLLGASREFGLAPGSPFRAGPGAYNVTVGDLDEDGKLDVAASSFEGNAVTVLLGQ
jgi:hypothetical protein